MPRVTGITRSLLCCAWVWLATAAPLGAEEEAATPNESPAATTRDPTAEQAQRDWPRLWKLLADDYVKSGGRFYLFRNYNPAFASSLKKRGPELKRSFDIRFDNSGKNSAIKIVSKKTVESPAEDIDAAVRALPALRPGEYGYIHAAKGCKLVEGDVAAEDVSIANTSAIYAARGEAAAAAQAELDRLPGQVFTTADELVNFAFLYRNQVLKIKGSPVLMRGFNPPKELKEYWTGPFHVAVLGVVGGRHLLVPVEAVKSSRLTEEEFLELLRQRGHDRDKFLARVVELRRDRSVGSRFVDEMFAWLENQTPPGKK